MSPGLQEGQGNIHTLDLNSHDPSDFGLDINFRKSYSSRGGTAGLIAILAWRESKSMVFS